MEKKLLKKLIIIPAFNEQDSILRTIEDIHKNAADFDYVVVNDCSTDKTLQICEENSINCLKLCNNLGIGGAVQAGYLYAEFHGYDIAVQFDGDGQHQAVYLDQMLDVLIESEADMVIGSRFIKNEGFQSSAMRRVGIKYFDKLINVLTHVRVTDPTSGMRMVNRTVLTMFAADYPKDYPEPESLVRIISKGKKVIEIPVKMNERKGGKSSISSFKSVYYMIKVTLAILLAKLQ